MTEELKQVQEHVEKCAVCSKANKRVNDFCFTGRMLFAEYAKTATPIRREDVTLTDEQYHRLVAETERAEKSGRDN
jgi:hypothetical protein